MSIFIYLKILHSELSALHRAQNVNTAISAMDRVNGMITGAYALEAITPSQHDRLVELKSNAWNYSQWRGAPHAA